jgi:hypothetical protein
MKPALRIPRSRPDRLSPLKGSTVGGNIEPERGKGAPADCARCRARSAQGQTLTSLKRSKLFSSELDALVGRGCFADNRSVALRTALGGLAAEVVDIQRLDEVLERSEL